MNERGGGIKAAIVLFSMLIVVSLMLLAFVFSIFSDNKADINNKLSSFNECPDIYFDIMNVEKGNGSLDFICKNGGNSKIHTITVISGDTTSEKSVEIDPYSTNRVEFENINLDDHFGIYVNDCINYEKQVQIK